MGRLTNDKTATEWKEFGTFYIDQRDTSFAGLVTVDCYDAMLKTNQNYLDGSDTAANWPKSMKSVVEEIAYRIASELTCERGSRPALITLCRTPVEKPCRRCWDISGPATRQLDHHGRKPSAAGPAHDRPRRDIPRHRRGLQQDHACQWCGQSAGASGL